jgi:predicted dithiol-disulfide oxidoreductase (DUF899 family)
MNKPKTSGPEEWLNARMKLLKAEKELTHQTDKVSKLRQQMPWVLVEKEYYFDTDEGKASFADLFRGNSQLLVYHFMYGPDDDAGCPSCSAIADGFNGSVVHLANHDVTLMAVSRAPLKKLQAYKKRMGWSFPWASSFDSTFNYDIHVTIDASVAPVEYNFRKIDELEATNPSWHGWSGEQPGMSSFALENGKVYHTYSTYARGLDAIWGMYPWFDRAPLGRNEAGAWWLRRHDEYDKQESPKHKDHS